MKKLLFVLLFLVLTLGSTIAQTSSGSNVVGARISYLRQTDVNLRQFNVGGQYRRFIADQLAVGVSVSYINVDAALAINDYTQFRIGGLVQRYFSITDRFYSRLGGSIYFIDQQSGVTDGLGIGAAIRPGLAYFLSDKWALESNLGGIAFQRVDGEDTFEIGFSNGVDLGLYFYF